MIVYEMNKDQLKVIMEACRPVPMIALDCGNPVSTQKRANNAWEALGKEMGFQYMTVKPNGKGDRFFSAEPLAEGV